MLRAADVEFGYGETPVVRGVSLDVPADGFVGIIGPNGSGKTTLLRLLAGTRQPRRGALTLDGVPLATLSRAALARRMAVVPQETQLAFEYTVLEVVLMGRYVHLGAFEVEGPRDLEIARRSLAATGTLDFQHRPFATLSGGEKQRVVIAAALAQISAVERSDTEPAILLLDEPTAALDLRYQLETAALLADLHRSHALSVVVSTHDLNFAASLCRTVVMLKDGQVLASGGVDDVLTPALVGRLYGVEVDVSRHPQSGHLTVVPLRRMTGARP
ncbi:MAG TPA: ABC transporter ATP-binding protein [Vicinamibacterales bacterium]|nr:ABC transporter ATP-binding protein [Vicinamibacterales bacterium]